MSASEEDRKALCCTLEGLVEERALEEMALQIRVMMCEDTQEEYYMRQDTKFQSKASKHDILLGKEKTLTLKERLRGKDSIIQAAERLRALPWQKQELFQEGRVRARTVVMKMFTRAAFYGDLNLIMGKMQYSSRPEDVWEVMGVRAELGNGVIVAIFIPTNIERTTTLWYVEFSCTCTDTTKDLCSRLVRETADAMQPLVTLRDYDGKNPREA